MRAFFETFRRTGSATATVRSFREQGLLFPRRLTTAAHKGEVVWAGLHHSRTLRAAQEPALWGRLAYGRSQTRKTAAGRKSRRSLPHNRVVAASLEADWNQKLRALTAAQEDYERRREADGLVLGKEQREQILALPIDSPPTLARAYHSST